MKNLIKINATLFMPAVLVSVLLIRSTACADTILAATSAASDATSGGNVWSTGNWELYVGGTYWNADEESAVLPFLLPNLGAISDPFSSASLGLTYFKIDGTPADNVDLYGLSRISSSSDVLAADYYSGALDGGNTLLQNDIITPSTTRVAADSPNNVFSTDIAAYLNSAYADGANAGQFVFLRLSYDAANTTDCYHIENNAGGGAPADWPQISYTVAAVPEPSSLALSGAAGLMALMVIRRRR